MLRRGWQLRGWQLRWTVLVVTLALTACGQTATPTPQPTAEDQAPVLGQALVESVEVQFLESFPLQAQAIARGTLPDGCTTLDQTSVSREGDTFTIILTTVRPADALCTELAIPFERLIPLDILNLPAGSYTVVVNAVQASFELQIDNIPPTATPPDDASASIRGLLWHDLCAVAGGTADEPAKITEGCVEAPQGGYVANGRQEAGEPPISGVEVGLGAGPCPQLPGVTSTTDDQGTFSFSGLTAGTYCVLIDPLSTQNRPILIPGRWTAPELDQGFAEITLGIGETVSDVHFGWDFDHLPPLNPDDCTNQAEFIADVTIPDDTVLAPGEVFTKTWRIRNSGTCHWGPDYSLAFAAGDQMEGEAVQLPVVLAGDEVDVSVVLTAPLLDGEYRGDWQLVNPAGEPFGKVGDLDLTFFVKIIVETPEEQ